MGWSKVSPTPFELWPRDMVIALGYHAPATPVRHPMTSTTRTTTAALRGYVRRVRRTCRLPPPVHGDVWLCLLFHMLPVKCHFAYLQVERPDAICCTYGYVQVETQRHAFHECATISPVWTFHQDAWSRFGVSFSWLAISFFGQCEWRPPQGRPQDAVDPPDSRHTPPHLDPTAAVDRSHRH
ncbi:Aste57867_17304 [Aphanomyces stellatus]|uniref:Aste57867_17304 protein n=1 Tax=Aphanomyces stellatus TaxID=120398 RepID=A0A485L899_9STRA|nr:hypothetical protein As57867_017245 [Aphanomyces stellatus]VFT94060.1 Aste57867_17304 [Aphanomyces stellatus]